MRILAVHNMYRQRGGEDVSTEAECRLLRSAGHQVQEYFRSNAEVEELGLAGKGALLWRTAWSPLTYREVRALIRQFRPDIVHCHNLRHVMTASVYDSCLAEGVPVIQHLHNFSLLCTMGEFLRQGKICEECVAQGPYHGMLYGCFKGSRLMTFAAARAASRAMRSGVGLGKVRLFIVPSKFARSKYVESTRFPRNRIRVLPNVVEDPGPTGPPRLPAGAMFVGRLSSEKGLDVLLEAWRVLQSWGRRVPLQIVGEGPQRGSLEARVRQASLDGICFRGWLTSDALLEAYESTSFLVLPSRCYETFGRVVVEAFASGRPAIVSRIGALRDLVREGRSGLLVEPNNPVALARAVELLATNPVAAAEMGRQARTVYETRYHPQRTLSNLEQIYREATSQRV